MKPELVKQSWDYFNNVQTKDQKYVPFIAKDTPPPTWLNKAILDKYRPEMKKYYYDPSKYSDLPRSARNQIPNRADRHDVPGSESIEKTQARTARRARRSDRAFFVSSRSSWLTSC